MGFWREKLAFAELRSKQVLGDVGLSTSSCASGSPIRQPKIRTDGTIKIAPRDLRWDLRWGLSPAHQVARGAPRAMMIGGESHTRGLGTSQCNLFCPFSRRLVGKLNPPLPPSSLIPELAGGKRLGRCGRQAFFLASMDESGYNYQPRQLKGGRQESASVGIKDT
jgi:hypothetical protein